MEHLLPKIAFRAILLFGMMLGILFSNFLAAQTQTFTTPGPGTFTLPSGVKAMKVEAWGGGGSGGNNKGAGGGGGSYARSSISGPFLVSYPYYIGAGGNNMAGGTTFFSFAPILVSADGGAKGGDNSSSGSAGGIATIGNESQINGTAGAGRSGNSGGNGGNAANSTNTGGSGGGNGNAGSPGSIPGGGGGGSGNSNNTRPLGGNGQIRISYIALTSATGTDSQTICSGSPIATTTYSVPTGSTVTVTNLPSGISSNYNSGTGIVTISGTTSNSATYTINVATNGITLSTTGSISTNSSTSITGQSTATQTQCIGAPFSPISVTATGTGTLSYQWYSNATASNTGGTPVSGANSASLTPPSSSAGTTYYYAVATSSCGSATSAVSGAFIVNPATSITGQSTATQTQCIGTSFSPISITATGTGAISYQWYSNSSASNTGGTPVSGANSASFTPPSSSVGTTYYYAVATSSCGSATSTVSEAFVVNPATSVTGQSTAAQTQCIGTPFSPISVTATGTGALSYQWYSNTTASPIDGTPVPGATSASFTPPSTSVGTTYYYAVATSSCGSATSAISGAFVVNPATSVTGQSTAAQSACFGQTSFSPISVTATGTGALSYQWYSNSSASNSGGTPVSGATSASFTPPSSSVGTTYYYAVATSSCGSDTSAVSGAFVVNPATSVTGQSTAAQTQCIGATFSPISVTATGTGTLSYQWYSNATATPIGGTPVPGATSASFTPPSSSVGTTYYYAVATSSCGSDTSAVSGAFVVNPATSINSESLAAQSACFGQSSFAPISVTATGTGTLSYQWYSNTTATNSGGTPVGANLPNYTPDASAIGTLYYYVVVSSDCGSDVSSVSGAFIVDPITSITTQPDNSDRVECFGDGFNPLSVTAVGGDLTYQWYRSSTQVNSGGTAVPGAQSASFTPPSSPEGISYYYVVVTGNCDTETSDISGEFRVNPPETVIDQNPSTADQTECLNDPFSSISVLASGEGTVTYQWYSNDNPSNSGGTIIPSETNASFTPPSDVVGTTYYYAVASSNCGTVPSDVSGAFTVTPPTSIASESLVGETICDGDTFSPISVSAIGTGTLHYQWYSNTSASISGPNVTPVGTDSNTFTPPTTAQGTTTYYFVEVSSDCGTNVISNPSEAFSVSLDNTAAAPSSDPTVCINTALTSITIATTGATGIANDGDNTGVNGLPAGVSATWSADVITISGTPTVSGTFNYFIPLTGGCGSEEATGTIIVTPDNTAAAPSDDPTLCIITPLTNVTIATTGATGIANDGDNSGVNGLPAGVSATWSGDVITISGTPTESGTFNYSIPMTGGCGAVNATGTIIVTPDNTATTPSSDPTLCINDVLTDITIATTGATGIANDGDNSGVNGLPAGVSATWAGDVITISGTPTVSGTFNYSIPLTGGCGAVHATGTITVNPLATVGPTSVAYPSVCISSPTLTPFTQATTGVTGIGTPVGLPNGVTASFDTNTGLITFSGTATAPTIGPQSYSIPLFGTCINGLEATGTIEVSPNYTLTAVTSVSATSVGGSATISLYGDPTILSNGAYEVVYEIAQGAGAFSQVGPVDVNISNGKGSFLTTPISNTDETYAVRILSIKKKTDVCTVQLPNPPTTYFGVCAAIYTSDDTFYVPANVYSVTIEVYGGGGGGENGSNNNGGGGGAYSIRTLSVTPGEAIAAFIGNGGGKNQNGETSYVTRDSQVADQIGNSLLYAEGGISGAGTALGGATDSRYAGGSDGTKGTGANGGNGGGPLGATVGKGGNSNNSGQRGLVKISYSCPDPDETDCISYIDDGSISGTTIIEFSCDYTWTAPEGLLEFSVFVGGGGGGGGKGSGGGGGGAGGIAAGTFSTSNPYGFPSNSSFTIIHGEGGQGGTLATPEGENGQTSSISGNVDGIPQQVSAIGGGGGASSSSKIGKNGATGGGGAADINGQGNGGQSSQGSQAGNGAYFSGKALAGGGGGGLGGPGDNGKAAGGGQGEGGAGGAGISLAMGDSLKYFGGGGGGIGDYFNGTDKAGIGGKSPNGIRIGGNGNLDGIEPIGEAGTDQTGSGGGAGYYAGGKGGDGVVYIYYFNYRILEVEYLNFEANYDPETRVGKLVWTTAKEWGNAGFEIERAVNNSSNWEKIGEVTGNGFTDSPIDYTFTDANLPASGGNIFYRLKQVDFDGSYSYGVVKSIQIESLKGNTYWIAYPNPSSSGDKVVVDLLDPSAYTDEPIYVLISDVKGISSTYSLHQPNEVSEVVNSYLDQANVGLHIVQLIWGDHSQQLKLIRK